MMKKICGKKTNIFSCGAKHERRRRAKRPVLIDMSPYRTEIETISFERLGVWGRLCLEQFLVLRECYVARSMCLEHTALVVWGVVPSIAVPAALTQKYYNAVYGLQRKLS